jgi:hypothetical protein
LGRGKDKIVGGNGEGLKEVRFPKRNKTVKLYPRVDKLKLYQKSPSLHVTPPEAKTVI